MMKCSNMMAAAAVASLLVPVPSANGGVSCNCIPFSAVVFLTAVLVWVVHAGLTSACCYSWIPNYLWTIYEFVISFVVFKFSLHTVWYPLETFIYSKLPELLGGYLDGQCPFMETLCPHAFVVLINLVAAALLVTVLYASGVLPHQKRTLNSSLLSPNHQGSG